MVTENMMNKNEKIWCDRKY